MAAHKYVRHRVVSWTVEESSCIFSVTIAGSPPSHRPGDWQWIFNASVGFRQIMHTPHAEILCANIRLWPTQQWNSVHLLSSCPISYMYWDTRRYFSANVMPGFLCSPGGEFGTRSFYTVSLAPLISCHWAVEEGTSVCHFKSVPTWWLRWLISACLTH